MKIVIDTNVLIAAIIKNSLTRRILLFSGYKFYLPEYAFDEFLKYEATILQKAKLPFEHYREVLGTLLVSIHVVRPPEYNSYLKEAEYLFGAIDQGDVPFLAAALALDAVIWSEDKDFEKQDKVKILKTKDFSLFY